MSERCETDKTPQAKANATDKFNSIARHNQRHCLFDNAATTNQAIFSAIFNSLLGSTPIYADTIAVIGTGDVAGALGPEFAAQGHTIIYGSRNPSRDDVRALVARTGNAASATTPAESVAGADIVVMAVPGTAVEAVTRSLGDLSGKIIIDPTNAIDRSDNGYLVLVYSTSTA